MAKQGRLKPRPQEAQGIPSVQPAASPVDTTVKPSAEGAGSDALNLAKGFSGFSKGLESFFQLQAVYGEQNMKLNKLRGAMGLDVAKGQGLGWGSELGHHIGAGEAAGARATNEYLSTLKASNYFIDINNPGDFANSAAKRRELFESIQAKHFPSGSSIEFTAAGFKSLAEADLTGEANAQVVFKKVSDEAAIRDMTDSIGSFVDKLLTSPLLTKSSPESLKQYRELISVESKKWASIGAGKFTRDDVNKALVRRIEVAILDELNDEEQKPDYGKVGALLDLVSMKDSTGVSISMTTPEMGKVVEGLRSKTFDLQRKRMEKDKKIQIGSLFNHAEQQLLANPSWDLQSYLNDPKNELLHTVDSDGLTKATVLLKFQQTQRQTLRGLAAEERRVSLEEQRLTRQLVTDKLNAIKLIGLPMTGEEREAAEKELIMLGGRPGDLFAIRSFWDREDRLAETTSKDVMGEQEQDHKEKIRAEIDAIKANFIKNVVRPNGSTFDETSSVDREAISTFQRTFTANVLELKRVATKEQRQLTTEEVQKAYEDTLKWHNIKHDPEGVTTRNNANRIRFQQRIRNSQGGGR